MRAKVRLDYQPLRQRCKAKIQISNLLKVVTSVISENLAYDMHICLPSAVPYLSSVRVLTIHKKGKQAEQLKLIN